MGLGIFQTIEFVDVSQTSLTIPRSDHVKETADDDNKQKEGVWIKLGRFGKMFLKC